MARPCLRGGALLQEASAEAPPRCRASATSSSPGRRGPAVAGDPPGGPWLWAGSQLRPATSHRNLPQGPLWHPRWHGASGHCRGHREERDGTGRARSVRRWGSGALGAWPRRPGSCWARPWASQLAGREPGHGSPPVCLGEQPGPPAISAGRPGTRDHAVGPWCVTCPDWWARAPAGRHLGAARPLPPALNWPSPLRRAYGSGQHRSS